MPVLRPLFAVALVVVAFAAEFASSQESRPVPNLITERSEARTSYQQAGAYDPRYDLKTDVVMVYGVSDAAIASLKEWGEKSGSKLAVMTGVAWGGYGDYLDGKFDGVDHWDDAQVKADDQRMQHDPATPYLSPSVAFSNYLESRLRKVVDAGVDEIYLEEPEFWAFTGFGKSFQREWRMFYNEDFVRPDSSVDAQYRASKLKYYLYRRALDRVASSLKEYSLKTYDRPLKIYVATHSLVSYAQIQMVSPESSLLELPGLDGLIAQIWTGTSRFGNFYNGVFAERSFESAMLEYGVMQEMVRGTNKRVYYLNDPVEDNPNYDWNDYRFNYLSTLVASLLRSGSSYYEVAPWPSRVFLGKFPAGSPDATTIPSEYASTLSLVFQQLRDMDQSDVEWLDAEALDNGATNRGATEGIGVLLADSSMFQRAAPTKRDTAVETLDDPTTATANELNSLSDFLGLATPLIKRGIPVDVPVLDNVARFPNYLDQYKVLLLSYDYQKPSGPGLHATIADWVSRGGALVFVDSRKDPYNKARDWWNESSPAYDTPGDHLLTSLGLKADQAEGEYEFGAGRVYVVRKRPAHYLRSVENGNELRAIVESAAAKTGIEFVERNYFLKRRGPYLLASVMTESTSDEPLVLRGKFVDLFDPELKVVDRLVLSPEQRAWALELNKTTDAPNVLASSCRVESMAVENDGNLIKLETTSPSGIEAISLIKLNRIPKSVKINGADPSKVRWDGGTQTLFFKFHSEGKASVEIALRTEENDDSN
ncbi:MAG: hypothetical protein IJM30_00570 [Thermoguttaceae bacterium]|nr:hypothetical protein [Thermoguttaceae bacterium]